jgi:prepilin-type N-terminal cleavage/methylation domain-containing protein
MLMLVTNISMKNHKGFTIVELLVVIVIIGILATITTVSYTNITRQAVIASLRSDLKNASTILELDRLVSHNESYPMNISSAAGGSGLKSSANNTLNYYFDSTSNQYCLTAENPMGISYYINSSDKTPTEGSCPSTASSSFAKAYGGSGSDWGLSVIQTSDGGYATTGYTTSYGAGNMDILTIKYNSGGEIEWSKTWGGANHDVGYSITETSDGSYIITGKTTSFGVGLDDMVIIKYNSAGDLLWNHTWGVEGLRNQVGESVAQTSDGGYIVTGSNAVAGGTDVIVVKYNSAGDLLWNRTWGSNSINIGMSIIQTLDGGYAITGQTNGYGAGSADLLFQKYDSAGNIAWTRTWGDSETQVGRAITQAGDGSYYITGSGGTQGQQSHLLKFSLEGDLIWNRSWGGESSYGNYGLTISENSDIVVTGAHSSQGAGNFDVLISRFTSEGNLVWDKTWGGDSNDFGRSIYATSDGGFVVTGYSQTYGSGGSDLILLKYDASSAILGCSPPTCQSHTTSVINPSRTITNPSTASLIPIAIVTEPNASASSPAINSLNIFE